MDMTCSNVKLNFDRVDVVIVVVVAGAAAQTLRNKSCHKYECILTAFQSCYVIDILLVLEDVCLKTSSASADKRVNHSKQIERHKRQRLEAT